MSEKEVFSCLICGKEFDNLSLAEDHVSSEHKEVLGEGIPEHFVETSYLTEEERRIRKEDFEKFCKAHPNDPICEEIIKEGTEENPDETEIITEEELVDKANAKKAVDAYFRCELSDTEEKMLLSRLLGQTTKSADKKAHDKGFAKRIKIDNWDKEYLSEIVEKINNGICPFCNLHYTQNAFYEGVELPENLAKFKPRPIPKFKPSISEKQTKPFDRPDIPELKPKLVITHIKSKHINLFNVLKDLFKIPEGSQLKPHAEYWSSNPESCSDSEKEELSLENLSEEEAIQKAKEDPNFRRMVFKAWKKKRETKKG